MNDLIAFLSLAGLLMLLARRMWQEQHRQNNAALSKSSQRERDSQSHQDLHSDFAGSRAATFKQESMSLEGGLADR